MVAASADLAQKGGGRADVARCSREPCEAVLAPCCAAPCGTLAGRAQRPSAPALAAAAAQGRPAVDRAAGSAHRGRHAARAKSIPAASPLPARSWSATAARSSKWSRRPRIGRRRCWASAGCAICAPPNPASPAPMRARWSTNGSRCRAPGIRSAWRPDVLSRRIISWLSQSTLVLQDADVRFYRRFLRSLVRQVRYLRHTAGDARRGVARMQAAIALTYAALCIAGQSRHIKSDDRAADATSSSGKSCPMAAMSAAIPARSSRSCWNCCRCGRRSPRATSRRRRRCSTPSTA